MSQKVIEAVIIDDDADAREMLRLMIGKYCPHIHVKGEADTVSSGKNLIENTKPELIFLDVEMPPGTGFDVLSGLPDHQAEVIFTTAHDHYAIHAIKVSAIDYLLKPVAKEDLIQAVAKLRQKGVTVRPEIWDVLRNHLEAKKEKPERIVVASLEGYEILRTNDILYCEGDGNYTTLFVAGRDPLIASKILKEYERLLPAPDFIRVHAKYLVNINYVKKYMKGRGGTLVMTDGKNIEVSQNRKQDLLDALVR
jgi:two-component system, LytTR family, response regulator